MASLSSTLMQRKLSPSQFLAESPVITRDCCSSRSTVAPSSLQVVAVKKIQGRVVKTVNDKTAAVEVKRLYAHPLYKKRISSVKTYQAHDPENKCKVGDLVTLAKCAPVSKSKKFLVVDIQPPRVAGAARAAASKAEAESLELPLESDVSFV